MRTIILAGVGALITLAGVIITLQGVGVIGGSAMSGTTFWAAAGPVIAVIGLPWPSSACAVAGSPRGQLLVSPKGAMGCARCA